MGTFGTNRAFGSGKQMFVAQPMTNGKILCHFSDASTWIFEPDAFGQYETGSFRRVADAPLTHLYGAVTVAQDGCVWFHGGEGGTAQSGGGANGATSIFDPTTETWRGVPFATAPAIASHVSVQVGDDGRMFGNAKWLAPYAQSPVHATTAPAWNHGESGPVLLPDGRFMGFSGQTAGRTIDVIQPAYPSSFVSAGSFNGTNIVTQLNYTSQLAAFGVDWRCSSTQFTSQGAINYEPGTAIYMPKIGKVVLVSGQGHIYTWDPATATLARPAGLPMGDQGSLAQSRLIGTAASVGNGQTQNAVVATGSFTVDVADSASGIAYVTEFNAQTADFKKFYVSSSSGARMIAFNATGCTFSLSSLKLVFSGVSANTNFTNTTDTVVTGARVTSGRPNYTCMDAPCAIMPNGNLVFLAGVEYNSGNNYFNARCRAFVWDGSSALATPLVSDATGSFDNAEFVFQMMVVPDGAILFKSYVDNWRIYEGSGLAEIVPLANSRPTITSMPTELDRGQTFTLTGTQLCGLTEGGAFGDDGSPRSNFPVVRFTNTTTAKVFDAFTYNFSYRGIGAGRAGSCLVKVPNIIDSGNYLVEVIANGVKSVAQPVLINASKGADEGPLMNSYRL
jgi:hypothetical protein